ncbi:Mrp/NBP35 family ATP-binding protein [Peptoniphilus equinus]|uniref:Iron-sulfur cluster carrier protein n=1 Tax=Peptoniphilus equinus TaxID=3016343 RepID=A0ABY7QUS6_9FIRM|nr:Mrp/NBP35 family ATP-binding protein [Peptoniphilus equinus]WBW50542.1 Mrp/NBP35 family ATP-binding protein [Peptoniphilus equinus]
MEIHGPKKFTTNEYTDIKKILGVISGKGGVGKSFVCQNLAVQLRRQGYKVGILDADITGPSVPSAFGIGGQVYSDGKNITPAESATGIKVVSVNLILDRPTDPVLWRAPVVGSAISQFYENVNWGELDYLLVDMPPGTSDVALTVYQSLPVDGVVIVSSPQDLVEMIVEKAIKMAKMMTVPVVGLVENMAYFKCPHCGEITYLYGESKLRALASKYDIRATLQIPMDSMYSRFIDEGQVEHLNLEGMDHFAKDVGACMI